MALPGIPDGFMEHRDGPDFRAGTRIYFFSPELQDLLHSFPAKFRTSKDSFPGRPEGMFSFSRILFSFFPLSSSFFSLYFPSLLFLTLGFVSGFLHPHYILIYIVFCIIGIDDLLRSVRKLPKPALGVWMTSLPGRSFLLKHSFGIAFSNKCFIFCCRNNHPKVEVLKMENKLSTKERLINAACTEFANMGYSKARIREISRTADVNLAAVNYHFGSKAKLYLAVLEYVYARTEGEHPSLPEPESCDRETALQILKTSAEHFFDSLDRNDIQNIKSRILYREMMEPSEMHDEVFELFLRPRFDYLEKLCFRICSDGCPAEMIRVKLFHLLATFIFYSNSRPLLESLGGSRKAFLDENRPLIMRELFGALEQNFESRNPEKGK